MRVRTRPVGAILAGGGGRRIGGDKAIVELHSRPLISYPLQAVRQAVGRVAILAPAPGRGNARPPAIVCALLAEREVVRAHAGRQLHREREVLRGRERNQGVEALAGHGHDAVLHVRAGMRTRDRLAVEQHAGFTGDVPGRGQHEPRRRR